MTAVNARAVARRDGRAIVAHYRTEADRKVAQPIVDALNDALRSWPNTPSPDQADWVFWRAGPT